MQNESIFGRFKHREKQGFDEVHSTRPFTLENKDLSWKKIYGAVLFKILYLILITKKYCL